MLRVLVASAWSATTDSGLSCGDAVFLGVRPANRAVVPPDVPVLAAGEPGCAPVPVVLRDDYRQVEGETVFVGPDQVVFTPSEPFEPGGYRVFVGRPSGAQPISTFEVDEDAPPPPPPPGPTTFELTADRTCGSSLFTRVEVTLGFPSRPLAGWALVDVATRTENGVAVEESWVWNGQEQIVATEDVLGGREACARVTVRGWDGEVAWADEQCAEPFEGCPELPPPEPDRGCGCAAAPPAPAGALLLLGGQLVLGARFRRDRR